MTSGCRVAIVADDLTGALDAAAPFARRGASTRVVIALERLAETLAAWGADVPEVVAVNTESRHLPAAQAAARVDAAIAGLGVLAPRLWFKKVDSTLRGPVVAECLAARRACGRYLMIAPAVPAQGRTLRRGGVFVHGEPLAATDFAGDARSAAPHDALDTLFAAQGLDVALLSPGEAPGVTHRDAVADAECDADLDALAARLIAAPTEWLAVGAAGLAGALARAGFGAGPISPALDFPPLVFVVGSRSRQAQRQLARLRASDPDLTVVAVGGDDTPIPVPAGNALLIPEASTTRSAPQVADSLAEALARLLGDADGERQLFLTGGDTAMAVMRRLAARYVEVRGEWAPGVVYGRLDGVQGQPVLTKAGGFGGDDLLVRLREASTTRG